MSCEKVENCLVGQPWLLSKLLNGPHMSSITLPTYLSPSLTDEQAPLVSSLLPLTVNAPAGGSLARARRPGLAGLASEEPGPVLRGARGAAAQSSGFLGAPRR